VERVGEGAAHSPGDRVAWGQHRGSAAGLVTLPASAVVSVPAGLELDIAAAAMLQGLTAHYLVNSTYAVQPGDTVLAQPWPAEWVSCSSSSSRPRARPSSARRHGGTDEKAAKATALGADHVINYTEVDDLGAAVRELTGGTGVHVVYDGVGTSTFDASLAACDHVARSSSSARPVGRCPRSTSSG